MNGRQMPRSGLSTAHHQRQHSDNLLDTGSWLQSNGAQQDYGYYRQGVRGVRNGKRGGGGEYYTKTSTPTVNPSRISRKNSEEQISQNEFSPGLLDLHSHDTELLLLQLAVNQW